MFHALFILGFQFQFFKYLVQNTLADPSTGSQTVTIMIINALLHITTTTTIIIIIIIVIIIVIIIINYCKRFVDVNSDKIYYLYMMVI